MWAWGDNLLGQLGDGTSGGVRNIPSKVLFGTVTEAEHSFENHPVTFHLGRNFPNPFNPTTAIRYQIAENDFVRFAVYDLLGREVAVLVNEMKTAGTYKATWNASSMPSGVYFYTLSEGKSLKSKKLLLLK